MKLFKALLPRLRTLQYPTMYNINQHSSPKEQQVQIASNSCYSMLYDGYKNRVYFTIQGYWKNKACIPDFISDWNKTLSMVKPGFSILTDMQTMITHPQELSSMHEQAHNLVVEAGVEKVAHVMPADKIAYLQVISIHDKTNLPAKTFTSIEEADQWLDIMAAPSAN